MAAEAYKGVPRPNMATTSLTPVRKEADLTLPWMTTGLLDHLVGLEKEARRNGEAEGLDWPRPPRGQEALRLLLYRYEAVGLVFLDLCRVGGNGREVHSKGRHGAGRDRFLLGALED